MKSAAQHHFPQVFAKDGQKWLFNPVLKKRFKNRPEERVRLQWVDFLLHQTDWSRNRIGFETPVQLRREDRALRADLLLYSSEVAPYALIECKSDHVKLNDATAMQAARYNSLLNAPYIILTNGVDDLVYKVESGKACSADYPFDVYQEPAARELKYWQERGFCSQVIHPDLKKAMGLLQSRFWVNDASAKINYLSFKGSFLPVPMDHYYRIFSAAEDQKIAIALMGYGSGANYMTAVLNKEGVNCGICAINLDELVAGENGSIRLFLQNREILLESEALRKVILNPEKEDFHKTLVKLLMSFFD